jgi:membrane-bound lytic murein transglycosylase B
VSTRRKPIAVAASVVCLVTAAVLVSLTLTGATDKRAREAATDFAHRGSVAPWRRDPLPAQLPRSPSQLALEINGAQRTIDDPASSARDLASAGLLEQLATGALADASPRVRRATLAMLDSQAAATMRTNLAASAALSRLTTPHRRFPPWKIAAPPTAGTLLGYFRTAQMKFGVGWQYLAAIEFIETRFGRVDGLSSAGAQGPMQFLPTTWAMYGRGNIDNQRDAIVGAARYLVANGAPGDMANALYRYNNSTDYVAAVQDYANRMRADSRAYGGYYNWQVIYAKVGGEFILPVGYPRARPVPVRLYAQPVTGGGRP